MTSADYNAYHFILPSYILCRQRAVLGFLGEIYCFLLHHITLINPVSNKGCMGRQRQGCAAGKCHNHSRKIPAFHSFNWFSIQESVSHGGEDNSQGWGPLQLMPTAWVRCLSSISRYRKQHFLNSHRIYKAECVKIFDKIILF